MTLLLHLELIDQKLSKIFLQSGANGRVPVDELLSKIQEHLLKVDKLKRKAINAIATTDDLRDVCIGVAKQFVNFGQLALESTLRCVHDIKSKVDTAPTLNIDSIPSTKELREKMAQFDDVKSRYVWSFILLDFVSAYDDIIDTAKHRVAELKDSLHMSTDDVSEVKKTNDIWRELNIEKVMVQFERSLREQLSRQESGELPILFDPSMVTDQWGELCVLIRMLFFLFDKCPAYSSGLIMLSAWVVFPSNFRYGPGSRKVLYYILAQHLVRVSCRLCDVDSFTDIAIKESLNAMKKDYLENFDIKGLCNSHGKLIESVESIALFLGVDFKAYKSGPSFMQRIRAKLGKNLLQRLLRGVGVGLREIIVGYPTDLVSFPLLLFYRFFDGTDSVTFMGRTYEDSFDLIGRYEGNNYIFKPNTSMTWSEWFRMKN